MSMWYPDTGTVMYVCNMYPVCKILFVAKSMFSDEIHVVVYLWYVRVDDLVVQVAPHKIINNMHSFSLTFLRCCLTT